MTRKADYAVRLMIEVSTHPDSPIGTAKVAQRQQIPYQFLRKVVQTLVSKGLIVSERGVHGGLSLARPPETITMLEVVSAFGPPGLNRCTVEPPRCERRDFCPAFPVWLLAQKEVDEVLSRTRLSDLVERQAALARPGKRRAARQQPSEGSEEPESRP